MLHNLHEENIDEVVNRIMNYDFLSKKMIHILIDLIIMESERCVVQIKVFYTLILRLNIFNRVSIALSNRTKEFNLEELMEWKEKNKSTEEKIKNIIENDDVEALQIFASSPLFDINMEFVFKFKHLKPYVHNNFDDSIIGYSAFVGALHCFKYLYMNHAELSPCIVPYSIAGGNAEIIRLLEQNGFKVAQKDIFYAIRYHQNDIFDWLIEIFPDIDRDSVLIDSLVSCFLHGLYACDEISNNISLFFALKGKHNSLQGYMIHILSTVNSKFCMACRYGDFDTIEQFLQNPDTDINETSFVTYVDYISPIWNEKHRFMLSTPLFEACVAGNAEIVSKLLQCKKIKVNKSVQLCFNTNDIQKNYYSTPLCEATVRNKKKIVKLLLDHPYIKINKQCCERYDDDCTPRNRKFISAYPLLLAIDSGFDELVDLFLNREDIDINQEVKFVFNFKVIRSTYPLHMAIVNQNHKLFKRLLKMKSIQLNRFENSPLKAAIDTGDKKIIKSLIKHPKIKVNQIIHDKMTPLIYAASKDANYAAKMLLKHCDIEINQTVNYDSALTIAIKKNNEKIVKYMMGFPKLNINMKTTYQNSQIYGKFTPLMVACIIHSPKIIKLLMCHPRIKINKACGDYTALSLALTLNHYQLVEILLESPDLYVPIEISDYDIPIEIKEILVKRSKEYIDEYNDSSEHVTMLVT